MKKEKFNKELYEDFHNEVHPPATLPIAKDGMYHYTFKPLTQKLNKGMKALDIGCGNGTISIFMGSVGADVLGIDISENAIVACKQGARQFKLSEKVKFENKKLEDLKGKATYDFIILSEVLEHLPGDEKVLRRIKELLKKDATLMVTVPSKKSLGHRIKMRVYKKDKFDERVGHLRRYEKDQLEKLMKKSGYRNIEFYKGEGPIRNMLLTSDRFHKIFYGLMKVKMRKPLEWLDTVLTPVLGEAQIIITAQK